MTSLLTLNFYRTSLAFVRQWAALSLSGQDRANTSSRSADSTASPGLVKPPCASTRVYLAATEPGLCCLIVDNDRPQMLPPKGS